MTSVERADFFTQYRIPKLVQRALVLLRDRRALALRGAENHLTTSCPVACAYGVRAPAEWARLRAADRECLIRAGWNRSVYNAFMEWYDRFFSADSDHILREFLEYP